ncbi:lipopolysaccharide assembly protein LapB [Neiella marina]|uniref:Lipopolysaccharide assembly protein B n=1 Tax=Neiella holothuriorum TaxID=2870530 RepID=A0ABS7EJ41_9GAMM|nr:lipopolysaccharide assembly protein LapB [Neiella holothuriorum]MBW8192369.1 lipopolysaccharide assembly protein LapB [Neiella holothuriorum]
MLELLFLLLPVAAAYGWYMGRRSAAQQQKDQQQQLSEKYVSGLNYLLSDEADKAVDLFIEMIKVDSDTIDTHMALASLFRKRGEVERAIKLHQNILERTSLSQEQHRLAVFELARDFSAVGLLDRAEALYKTIAGKRDIGEKATRELVSIYQSMRDWPSAIQYAERLPADCGMGQQIAQLYCQLGEELPTEKSDQAIKLFKRALRTDPNCVRASIMAGQWYLQREQYQTAIEQLQHVLNQDVNMVSEVIVPLENCYRQLGETSQLQHFLMTAVERGAGASTVISLAELLKQQDLSEDAELLELTQLRRYPSLKGFFHYMDYHLAKAMDQEAKASLVMLQHLVGQQLAVKPKYRCLSCGFAGNVLQWQCPSCKSWGETKPVRGLDGE